MTVPSWLEIEFVRVNKFMLQVLTSYSVDNNNNNSKMSLVGKAIRYIDKNFFVACFIPQRKETYFSNYVKFVVEVKQESQLPPTS